MKKLYLYLAIASACFWQCTEEKDWREPADGTPPGTVTNVTVENFNGGAVITYTPPADQDLLAVKAVYTYKEGEATKSVWSSANKREIVLEGFADTLEHTVMLYAVDKSMNESPPVQANVRPKTPPVNLVRKTLRLQSTFGGVYATWSNEQQNLIDISISVPDEGGQYRLGERYYTSTPTGKYTFRGYTDQATKFRVHIRDRWNNYAAPFDTVLTPIYEEELVRRINNVDQWFQYGYDGLDNNSWEYRGDAVSTNFRVMLDDAYFRDGTYWVPRSGNVPEFPFYFTFDLRKKTHLSRLRFWMRDRHGLGSYISAGIMNDFEVWGSNNPRPIAEIGGGDFQANLEYWTAWQKYNATNHSLPSGHQTQFTPIASMNGTEAWKTDTEYPWTQLGDFKLYLPSGIHYDDGTPLTTEDIQFVIAGFSFDYDATKAEQSFRYLRFVVKDQTSHYPNSSIAVMRMWGYYDEE